MPLEIPLLYSIVLAILGFFFPFPYEVEYCPFKFCEEFRWDFDGQGIESVDCFW